MSPKAAVSPKAALLFPGQGSQSVGMGEEWARQHPAAREAFEQADEVLGFFLSRLCWEGPDAELQLTANTQPAILATSVAVLRVLQQEGIRPSIVAGHSLGEYSALVAAQALDYPRALQLVRLRGQYMQEAVPVGEGAMAAILGLAAGEAAAVASEAAGDEVCSVANINAPAQTVIAGHLAAVERAIGLAKERGARRAMLLPVSAPFHCPLMAPARAALAPHLEETAFADPVVPVVCNVDAVPLRGGAEVRAALRRQIDGAVRWLESIQWMVEQGEVELFVEVGPGTVLTGLNRRIAPTARTLSLSDPQAMTKLMDLVEPAT